MTNTGSVSRNTQLPHLSPQKPLDSRTQSEDIFPSIAALFLWDRLVSTASHPAFVEAG
jgi:hypothetical protein